MNNCIKSIQKLRNKQIIVFKLNDSLNKITDNVQNTIIPIENPNNLLGHN